MFFFKDSPSRRRTWNLLGFSFIFSLKWALDHLATAPSHVLTFWRLNTSWRLAVPLHGTLGEHIFPKFELFSFEQSSQRQGWHWGQAHLWQLGRVCVLVQRQAVVLPHGEVGHVDLPAVLATALHREVLDAQVDLAHHFVAVQEVEPAFNGLTGNLKRPI